MTQPSIDGLTYIEHLGSGGYSDVYLYERRSPKMRVAVKVLKEGRLSGAELAQFAAEAETMAQLADHPNIVQVFSTGTTDDGRPYLVMKYYPPPNLGERANRERFTVAEVLRTGVKIASAVETAHRAGILHRDIKPANILVSQYGEPGLTDFGIAGRGTDEEADDVGVSIPWSPPEVLSGTSNGSPQSDVYSLAATIWHLLVGRSPFEVPSGDNSPRALMTRVLRTPPPATGRADVPPALDRLLQHAMSKTPALRPRSALEFAQGLQAVEQEQRFPRTDLVVESVATGTTGGRPGRATDEQAEDRTRMRAPTRVVAQPAARSSFAPPAGGATTKPATPPAEPPTTARPVVPGITQQPRARPATGAEPATTLRPATPTTDSAEAAAQGPRRGVKKSYALVAAAVALVGAVVIGIVVSAGGSGRQRAGQTVPTFKATDQSIGSTSAVAIKANYDSKHKIVHFTWTVEPAPAVASYLWKLQDDSTEHRTVSATADVRTSDPAATCIEVAVVVDGASSEYSAPQCGAP